VKPSEPRSLHFTKSLLEDAIGPLVTGGGTSLDQADVTRPALCSLFPVDGGRPGNSTQTTACEHSVLRHFDDSGGIPQLGTPNSGLPASYNP